MRLLATALLAALPLITSPAGATIYYGSVDQAAFDALHGPTPAVTFACAVDANPCAPTTPPDGHVEDGVGFSGPGLTLRSGSSYGANFDFLASDTSSFAAATVTASFAPTAAVGVMLAQGTRGSGSMTVSFTLAGGGQTAPVTRPFDNLSNFLFLGIDGVGPITGMSISVPSYAMGPGEELHYVAIGPIQFGTPADIPAPAALALLGTGLLGLVLVRRRG